jgi:hypothetical protein|tara:strand:- start:24 stop:233 length:210 start_codon:yes stop_codon:yes gene_type:complete
LTVTGESSSLKKALTFLHQYNNIACANRDKAEKISASGQDKIIPPANTGNNVTTATQPAANPDGGAWQR